MLYGILVSLQVLFDISRKGTENYKSVLQNAGFRTRSKSVMEKKTFHWHTQLICSISQNITIACLISSKFVFGDCLFNGIHWWVQTSHLSRMCDMTWMMTQFWTSYHISNSSWLFNFEVVVLIPLCLLEIKMIANV